MNKRNQKGFTLVELIVVIVIIGILAAITVPALLGYMDKADNAQDQVNARTAYLAAQTVVAETGNDSPNRLFMFNTMVQAEAQFGIKASLAALDGDANFIPATGANTSGILSEEGDYSVVVITSPDNQVGIQYKGKKGIIEIGPQPK